MNFAISILLLLQTPTPSPTPVALERMPALYTLIYVGGFGFVILLLLLGLIRNRRQPIANIAVPQDLPKDVKKRTRLDFHQSRSAGLALVVRNPVFWHYSVFTSTGPSTRRETTKSFSNLATRTCAIGVCRNQHCAAGCSTAAVDWTSHSRITNATRAATSAASIRWTKRWPISLVPIAAIRDWSAHCLACRAARCPKRWTWSKVEHSSSKATRTCV